MMFLARTCLVIALFLGLMPALAFADRDVRLGSWNIKNLSAKINKPLRPRAVSRSLSDFKRLKSYGIRLDADIIALQEMGSPEAVWRVFEPSEYGLIFSSRYTGEEDGDIYTALIYRKNQVTLIDTEQLGALAVTHLDGRPVRQGVAGLFEAQGTPFWVMSVHFKAGCLFPSGLKPAKSEACQTYAKQVPIIEQWIDEKEQTGLPVFVVGDFNRKFDRYGVFDHMWEDIDDKEPQSLNLHRLPYFQASRCPTISKSLAEEPVDFFVFNQPGKNLVIEDSFGEIIFSPDDTKAHRQTLSDHCPMFIVLGLD